MTLKLFGETLFRVQWAEPRRTRGGLPLSRQFLSKLLSKRLSAA